MTHRGWLVLSRRKGQTINVGDEVEILVTECHRSSVKLAIRDGGGRAILRGEVARTIARAALLRCLALRVVG